MSAQQTFALCIDCWEFHYGIPDSNGVYQRDSASTNHAGHAAAGALAAVDDAQAKA
mgnify:CR=1 FL=1